MDIAAHVDIGRMAINSLTLCRYKLLKISAKENERCIGLCLFKVLLVLIFNLVGINEHRVRGLKPPLCLEDGEIKDAGGCVRFLCLCSAWNIQKVEANGTDDLSTGMMVNHAVVRLVVLVQIR